MQPILKTALHQKTIEVFETLPDKVSDFYIYRLYVNNKLKLTRRKMQLDRQTMSPECIAKDMVLEYEVQHNLNCMY